MSSLNRCEFIGNLGKDPEVRSLQSGDKVANFSIACTETWKDKSSGEKKEKTEWVRCNVFGSLAKVVEQYVHKGDKVFVAGKLSTRKWQGQDGKDNYSTEININELVMLGSPGGRQDQNRGDQGRQQQQSGGGRAPDLDDEIPF